MFSLFSLEQAVEQTIDFRRVDTRNCLFSKLPDNKPLIYGGMEA